MKKYFITCNGVKKGPLTKEEMQQENINNETLVWYSGLSNWSKMSDLREFDDILIPPVLHTKGQTSVIKFKRAIATEIVRFVKAVVVVLVLAAVFASISYRASIANIDCELENINKWMATQSEEDLRHDLALLEAGFVGASRSTSLEYLQCSEYSKFLVNSLGNSYERQFMTSNLSSLIPDYQREEEQKELYANLNKELFALLFIGLLCSYIVLRLGNFVIRWVSEHSK
ncbi:DUF4339 domain-containing protein [Pontibacter actiniarum]|uniref:GYF domain-containing protein n=1 Tax=Pontibacter actiniarum TaxID=323450 RepID=A0A1X9YUX3_9BACT|nr:DUF4339 domain-containing protein [Pontibacter actiniarum]ARS36584.1 hypothetical protein CA264_14795 [Pontibacter actiniarum]